MQEIETSKNKVKRIFMKFCNNLFWNVFYIFITVILISGTKAFAQQDLDIAGFKFYYTYTWQFDTLKKNDIREDLIVLQVGSRVSKSYSYNAFQIDSLLTTPEGERIYRRMQNDISKAILERRETPKSAAKYKIYKNYPDGQVTVTDNISHNYYMYSDQLNPQSWIIVDSVKTLLDHSCQMAMCDFRGRRWIAWFSPDIHLSDGPWKFSGLPGLIMEVYDAEEHYKYSIVGIEQVQDEPLVFSPVVFGYRSFGKYEETTRLEFLRALARYLGMSSAIMNAELGIQTFNETTQPSKPFDFMERDYK
jgi:GLPGLI family protein